MPVLTTRQVDGLDAAVQLIVKTKRPSVIANLFAFAMAFIDLTLMS